MGNIRRCRAVTAAFSLLIFAGPALAAAIVIQQITFTTLCENFQPTISGDGKKIAFLSDCVIIPDSNTDQNYEIFLYDTETKHFLQITDTTGQKNNQPTINEDGALVAFRSSADLVKGKNSDGNPEIFLYDTKAKGLKQLTHTLSSPASGEGFSRVVHSGAVISPDGTKVVIASAADLAEGENKEGVAQFFLYDLTRKTMTQLTHMKGKSGMGHQHGPPALSDDGSRLVFLSTSDLAHDDHDGQPAIFLMDVPKAVVTPVAKATRCQLHSPSINGDGTRITFASTCNFTGENKDPGIPNMEIFLYNTATKVITQLTHTLRDFNHTPSMDRSGKRIAFGSDRDIHRGSNLDENSEIFLAIVP